LKETLEDLDHKCGIYARLCHTGRLRNQIDFIDDLGWDSDTKQFLDLVGACKNIFKLYPWEWLILTEEFGKIL
jgi:glutathionylspermidine synthase